MGRRGSHLARLGAVIALAALAFGVRALPAAAAPPELVLPPERLYTGVDMPIAFVGTDLVSGDDRAIDVTVTEDGCAPASGNGWSLEGCARVQLTVGRGLLAIPLETVLGGAGNGEPEGIVAGGAVIDESTNGNATGFVIYLNGTEAQIDDALSLLTWTPDSGYEYDGSNPVTLEVLVADGTIPADNVSHDIEIRVLEGNDAPTLTVPAQAAVMAGGTATLPPMPPLPGVHGDLFVEDPDGAGEDALLSMIATCGEVTLRGGALTLGSGVSPLLLGQGYPQEVVDAVVAALPAPVTAETYATGSHLDPHTSLLAIGDLEEIDYALSQIDFDAPASDGACQLVTTVTDLGNTGRPGAYEGSPVGGRDQPQPGVEVPDVEVATGVTTFVVGGGVEVGVPSTLSIGEGEVLTIPVSASNPIHPAVEVAVTAVGVTATGGGVDYDEPTSPVTFPEDAATLDLALATVEDADDEADETATVALALQGAPPGFSLANDTVTVTITDDDAAGPDTTDPTVTVEQGSSQADPTSTSPITFDVTFSEPVTGFAPSDVDLSSSTAGGTLVATVGGSGTAYTVEVAGMTTAGDVVARVYAGSASDAAGNLNDASTSTDGTVAWQPGGADVEAPMVGIDEAPGQADPTSTTPITFRVQTTEPVTGLAAADVDTSASTVGGTLAVAVTEVDALTYDLAVTGMTTAGDVVVDLPAGALTDLAGNPNGATVVVDATITWDPPADVTGPVATIDEAPGQVDPTSTSPVTFRATFDEPVTGLAPADVVTAGSTVGGTLAVAVTEVDPATYDLAITGMTTAGVVEVLLPAASVEDLAGNAQTGTVSVDAQVTWAPDPVDTTVPTVVVDRADDQPDPATAGPIRFVATFSEEVFGFDATDVLLDASTAGGDLVAEVAAQPKADGTSFVVTVSGMTTAGDVSMAIVGGAAVDAAGNASLASTSDDGAVAWLGSLDPVDPTDPIVPVDGPIGGPGAGDVGLGAYDTYDGYNGSAYGSGDGFLARTGLDLAGLLVLGTGVVGLGAGLVLVARRPWGRTG